MSSKTGLAEVMIDICTRAGPTKTIDPAEIAKAFSAAADHADVPWQNHLQSVRDIAVALAREGRIVIYRKGAPADPETFRGVYRLGVPNIS